MVPHKKPIERLTEMHTLNDCHRLPRQRRKPPTPKLKQHHLRNSQTSYFVTNSDTVKVAEYHTCGDKKELQFRQCAARLGSNVVCSPVTQNRLPDSKHICRRHMVKPNKDTYHVPE